VSLPISCIPYNRHSHSKVTLAIQALKNTLSVGADKIPIDIIKLCVNYIAKLHSNLFSRCLETGYFPKLMKIGKIILVLKNGEKSLISNYRPISLLSNFSKIFEKLL